MGGTKGRGVREGAGKGRGREKGRRDWGEKRGEICDTGYRLGCKNYFAFTLRGIPFEHLDQAPYSYKRQKSIKGPFIAKLFKFRFVI